ncbi:histone-lysine N-methyltransferase SETMAR [Plakobranchus ocellatus]|uniref:Histone-lysine N-methyltransferase SETMAR n=1 Tax=Plakobranchus ocellatus TaxID=259542 RepID=A0AAV4C3C4_9GAST|nr:histone-lysine N-methyltransferase SETMAR [Plakobranchus ocellatus]
MEISESGLKTRQLTTCTLHAFSCPRGMEPDYRRCICVKATSSQVQQQPYNPKQRQLPSQVPQPGSCPSDRASYDSNARTCRCFDTAMVYDPNLLTCAQPDACPYGAVRLGVDGCLCIDPNLVFAAASSQCVRMVTIVNAQCYKIVIQGNMRPAIRKQQPVLIQSGVIFHNDKAPVHTARMVSELLVEYEWSVLGHPSCFM